MTDTETDIEIGWTRLPVGRDWLLRADVGLVIQWLRENNINDDTWDFHSSGSQGEMTFQHAEDAMLFRLRFGCTK